MLHTLFLILTAFLLSGCEAQPQEMVASDARVNTVGRVEKSELGVKFDWSGVYMDVQFEGTRLEVLMSDSDRNFFNLMVDGRECPKFETKGDSLRVVLFDDPTAEGKHWVRIQKATEAQQGLVTVHSFTTDGKFLTAQEAQRPLMVEFYGDSLTCGYGTESKSGNEPFSIETENCKYTYAAYLADWFGADYRLISHSGRGLVRNYGDAEPLSDPKQVMTQLALQTFDAHAEPQWNFAGEERKPDAVVIMLGTNDFSTKPHPSQADFAEAYVRLIDHLREAYGNPTLPVLCCVHRAEALEAVKQVVAKLDHVAMTEPLSGLYNQTTEVGASLHPNREGQLRMAEVVIPRFAELTGWTKAE